MQRASAAPLYVTYTCAKTRIAVLSHRDVHDLFNCRLLVDYSMGNMDESARRVLRAASPELPLSDREAATFPAEHQWRNSASALTCLSCLPRAVVTGVYCAWVQTTDSVGQLKSRA